MKKIGGIDILGFEFHFHALSSQLSLSDLSEPYFSYGKLRRGNTHCTTMHESALSVLVLHIHRDTDLSRGTALTHSTGAASGWFCQRAYLLFSTSFGEKKKI